ncbi:helix-turn-helix transcriptional regulator [Carboxylicivirga sediminis]|uniref:Helix-turn-helix transcriptional regulator n=1 Tax=Carboxylicivirga sediminis TaxID=2006564 RepID=A0A941EZV4_9BACT|nr:AraC family transcriptional regulator [Carboxylicivirga sediminis]MBR8534077.1 helix-turn-helix transcriptional regulator [Carboxylicivirga sediminis]
MKDEMENMKNTMPIILEFTEGKAENYFKAVHDYFGGELKADSYYFKRGATLIHGTSLQLTEGIELSIIDAIHTEALKMVRVPDNNPDYYHLVIIHTGKYTQSFEQELLKLEADSTKGIFIYNGMFPLEAEFPANTPYKAITFKFHKACLEDLIPEAAAMFKTMYPSDEGIAYHIPTTNKVNQLADDILSYQKGIYGAKAMIKARAFEAFVIIMKIMEQMTDDELHGLHIDDYNRLMRIKKHLLDSLTDTINVEAIAEEFAISVSKLNRDFKALFDMTIYKFYTRAKMDEAYRRLQTGNYSVAEVGYDLGYSSLPKFSEMFKKVKGINPKDVIAL